MFIPSWQALKGKKMERQILQEKHQREKINLAFIWKKPQKFWNIWEVNRLCKIFRFYYMLLRNKFLYFQILSLPYSILLSLASQRIQHNTMKLYTVDIANLKQSKSL